MKIINFLLLSNLWQNWQSTLKDFGDKLFPVTKQEREVYLIIKSNFKPPKQINFEGIASE